MKIYKKSKVLKATKSLIKLICDYRKVNARFLKTKSQRVDIALRIKKLFGKKLAVEDTDHMVLATFDRDKPRQSVDWEAIAYEIAEKAGLKIKASLIVKYTKESPGVRKLLVK